MWTVNIGGVWEGKEEASWYQTFKYKYTFWYKKLCVLSAKHAEEKNTKTLLKLKNMNAVLLPPNVKCYDWEIIIVIQV